jgi:N-methylhydantoinase A/acetone carboxylase beta subunit
LDVISVSAEDSSNHPELLALDTGGTMTDSFVVDDEANYTVGKAQSTPHYEAEGVQNSFADAIDYWDLSFEQGADTLEGVVYAGTTMMNRLLEREGNSEEIGVITTYGFEDTHRFGRGIQSWAGMSYASRLHTVEHEHPEPLVPQENVRGVRERMHFSGFEIAPLYEDQVREAVSELVDRGVKIICVSLLHSYKNDDHEQQLKEVADEELEKLDAGDVEIWLSSEQNPVRGELPRLNTLLVEAYAVEPSRDQMAGVRDQLVGADMDAPFRVLSAHGGTISPDHDWLVETMVSGPIGGIFGGEYVADELEIENLVCSDVGGTSFDVGLITEGHYPTRWSDSMAQLMVNVPMPAMDTIGSGTGSYVRLDPTSNRLEVGPDSAGYRVGVANVDDDVETPTVTDCTAMLGYLNPDFFLGGDIQLDIEDAKAAFDEQIADPLGQDPYEAARGVLDTVERNMSNELRALILGLGYSPENYNLISYGGGGPLHAAGYTRNLEFIDVLVPEWAAAFSAFGSACTDYSYRYDQTVDLVLEPEFGNADDIAEGLTATFEELEDRAVDAFDHDLISEENIEFRPSVRIQYAGMLEDLEVEIPEEVWNEGIDEEGLRTILDQYEVQFERTFQRAAQSPENGYHFTTAVGESVAPSPKPTIPEEEVQGSQPPNSAYKSERAIYWDGDWHDADILRMGEMVAGNEVTGPAVFESPATTFLVPPGFEAEMDHHRIFHLTQR